MKRFTIFLALAVMIAAPAMAERVTPETARKVATTFLNNNGTKSNQLVDLSKAAGFPNLYIFSTESSFVVMSADDCVKPILGYSLTGSFDVEDMPDNVRNWLQGYSNEIGYAINSKMSASAETVQLWRTLSEDKNGLAKANVIVSPFIETKWNQNKYYNDSCPAASGGPNGHAYTGCVATAMAQVMNYWKHPVQGTGNNSYNCPGFGELSANFAATTYDWDNMGLYYEYYYSNANANSSNPTWLNESYHTTEKVRAVATLMYHCGVSVNMKYGGNGSGTATLYVADALKTYFDYSSAIEYKNKSSYSDEIWTTMVKAELDENRPLEYCGHNPENTSSGHAFVCDGYNDEDYFHFNWGWAGHYDGYFSLNNLNTGANNESGSGNGVYTFGQAAIFGIEPKSSITAPTLSASVNQNTITLSWNAIEGAISYDVYKHNVKIGTGITSTSFVDTNIEFGVYYEYYVRAVSSDTRSNPSNRITMMSDYRDFTPYDLSLAYAEGNVTFNWTGYHGGSSIDLQYGIDDNYYIIPENHFYWGQKYLANTLSNYVGMYINQLSVDLLDTGNYTAYLYKTNTSNITNQLLQQDFTVTQSGWNTINIDNPIYLDVSEDLWVVFYYYASGNNKLPIDYYNGNNAQYANYYGSSLETIDENYYGNNISWPITIHLTDGTYTYNLYEGTNPEPIASGISETSYTISDIANNAAHQYTVKTNYYAGLSEASNVAGLALGTVSLESLILGANDNMTITEGSKLIVSGSLTNDNVANLVLENGAQLIHNSSNVQATVKKGITAYTSNNDGWNFIASPVTENITPSEGNGLITNNYDLYIFDQSQAAEWRNYKANSFSTLNHKIGYLYANSGGTTLTFAGTLAATTDATPLVYDENAFFKGFNLIGNPYPCNTTIDKDFYVVDNNTITLAENGTEIAPCESVFVKATGANESVTFNKANGTKSNNAKDCFDLVITQGKTDIDRARVRLCDGIGMEKLNLDNKHSQISLLQNGQDFAVAYTNGANEMPLNIKVDKDGTYTIDIEPIKLDLDYLHIIDNMTGADVNLLATPSYTFEAKTSDYASRFRLVFFTHEDTEGDNAPFAYISNGSIIVYKDGIFQLVDMTGHVVYQGDAINRVSTNRMASGVYVLRLITTDSVKTQKIVIE